ncbi:MAG: helix-turn-helix domain-containing protein [Oscillospiraceae bacterium]|nr:helix-turn-helix domain-containing protein [Oscillospiraceae bacterium]
MENKTEIMAQIVALLTQLIDENTNVTTENKSSAPIEMLTIKECTQAVSGLSEHTVRQLVAQKKIPYIRTGQGKRGKILISKAALLEYLGGDA